MECRRNMDINLDLKKRIKCVTQVFSSHEHKVLKVSHCDHPASFNNFFKHVLINHLANLDETWQGCSLGKALQKLFNLIPSITLVAMAT